MSVSNAQINKGSFFVGGSLSGYLNTSDNYFTLPGSEIKSGSSQNISINPTVGYFIKQNFAIGLGLGYSYTYIKQSRIQPDGTTIDDYNKVNTLSITPYARYYFNLGGKIALFTQLGVIYSPFTAGHHHEVINYNGNPTPSIIDTKDQNISLNVLLSLGFSYFISDKCAIETTIGSIGYTASKYTNITTSAFTDGDMNIQHNSSFNLNFSISSITFGVKYFIRKL